MGTLFRKGRNELNEVNAVMIREKIEEIAIKYAGLIEKRIDNTDTLSGEDINDIYDGIQSLGHIIASMERLERMEHMKPH